MADENELKELINQAITCEHPHVYGTVNLNRLRDVLCLLVSVRKSYDGSFKEDSTNQAYDEETESSDAIEQELSKEAVKCNSLQIVRNELEATAQEANGIEIEENLNPKCRSSSVIGLEQPSTLSLQKMLLEIDEIGQKVNEICGRVSGLEAKLPSEQCKCKCSCGVIEDDERVNLSKIDTAHAQKTCSPKKPSSETDANESNFDVEQDERLNDANGSPASCGAAPSQAVDGNLIQESVRSDQSIVSSKTFKNNKPVPPNAVVPIEPHDEGANGQHEDGNRTLLASISDTGRNVPATSDDGSVFPKFDELVATVDGLVERERMFFERLANIEKLMSSYIDELHSHLQDEKCVPPVKVFSDNSNIQLLQPESCTPNVQESIQRKDGTKSSPETNIRNIIAEFQREICSLKADFNRRNIAAGGRIGTEIQHHHVQCLSCNCAAAMEIHEELLPTPVPFHVRRCMKPMLRRQRDWLQKELKFPAVVPVSMEPYYKLLRKTHTCTTEMKS